MSTADLITKDAVHFLRDLFLVRLAKATKTIAPTDLWWSPHEGAISIGTILRHLEGNVRQWILSGLAGWPDQRERAREFTDGPGDEAKVLLERLTTTVQAAANHIAGMSEQDLETKYDIQGSSVTGVFAVMHVVEHFSWHTGQAVWIAKSRAGTDHGIQFYDEDAINAAKNKQ
tara:strand:+ start:23 stop:541 length:519 start_codon:yes stop_codon:yes gene_type:complete